MASYPQANYQEYGCLRDKAFREWHPAIALKCNRAYVHYLDSTTVGLLSVATVPLNSLVKVWKA
jgi:hypothetical protein